MQHIQQRLDEPIQDEIIYFTVFKKKKKSAL